MLFDIPQGLLAATFMEEPEVFGTERAVLTVYLPSAGLIGPTFSTLDRDPYAKEVRTMFMDRLIKPTLPMLPEQPRDLLPKLAFLLQILTPQLGQQMPGVTQISTYK